MEMKAKKSKPKSKVTDSTQDIVVNYKIPEEETNTSMPPPKPPPKKKKDKKDSTKSSPPNLPDATLPSPSSVKLNIAPKQRITKSIYFADAASIDHLESMIKRYPKSSLSSVIQQLVQALVDADNNERVVEINTKIYL